MSNWIEMCGWLWSGDPWFKLWIFQILYFVYALRPEYSASVRSLKLVAVCQNTL